MGFTGSPHRSPSTSPALTLFTFAWSTLLWSLNDLFFAPSLRDQDSHELPSLRKAILAPRRAPAFQFPPQPLLSASGNESGSLGVKIVACRLMRSCERF